GFTQRPARLLGHADPGAVRRSAGHRQRLLPRAGPAARARPAPIDLANHLAAIAIERRQAEESLRTSEERLSRTVETNADGILILDRSGRISLANAAAERLTGMARADMLRRDPWDLWKISTLDGRQVGEHEFASAQV